jgi:glycosyltransferase involved in cell wall biosynthesis
MVVYTLYYFDARVRREAETIASLSGYSVLVLVPRQNAKPRRYELEGVAVQELDIRKYEGEGMARYLWSYIHFFFRALLSVTALFFKGKIDYVHVHNMPNFIVFTAIVPWLFGRNIILDIHDTMKETYMAKFSEAGKNASFLPKILDLEERISCRFAGAVICTNDLQKKALVDRGIPAEKITVVLNVPDSRVFKYNRSVTERDRKGQFRPGYQGTIAGRLGVDLAIRSVSRLLEVVPGLEFWILGGGESCEEFKSLSKDLGISDVVFFKDAVPVDQLSPILEEIDLGVIPNRRSVASNLMLPVKMLEYIALGIPVVAPRLTMIEHYFTDEMVYFFEPDDEKSLDEAILQAHGDKRGRIQKALSAKTFLDEYGWDNHKQRLINLYREM